MRFLFSIPNRIKNFFIAIVQEMRFVEWISAKETARLSGVVLSTMIFLSLLLAFGDKFFNLLISKLLEAVN